MMKILLKIILVISAFKAVVVLLLLIGAIIAWIKGADSVLLPGLGLIVAMPLIIILLLVAEVFLVAIVAFIWRYISKIRLQ